MGCFRMKSCFSFQKRLDFFSFLWYCVVLTGMEVQPMKNVIQELWDGNIMPQDDWAISVHSKHDRKAKQRGTNHIAADKNTQKNISTPCGEGVKQNTASPWWWGCVYINSVFQGFFPFSMRVEPLFTVCTKCADLSRVSEW